MASFNVSFQVLAGVFTFLALCSLLGRRRHILPLPPGPRGLPLIGNMWDIARSQDLSWIRYWKWAQVYGDIFQLRILGHRTIVLNSREAMTTLLEKRSYNYSDRPDMHMFLDKQLVGTEWGFFTFRHNDWWRLHRRTVHQRFQPRVMPEYYNIQRTAAESLMGKLAASPANFFDHINNYAGSILLKITYGYTLQEKDDPYMCLVLGAMEGIDKSGSHGFFWVDYFPFLKYVPAWFPGGGFKIKAREWKEANSRLKNEPWNWVKRAIEEGSAEPSFCIRLIERSSITPGDNSVMEDVIKNCAANAFVAGAETTAATLCCFILAMSLHPELQIRAQTEIDSVVGPLGGTLDFSDRDKLPFVNALIAETLRWHPVAPLGVAHRALIDDEYAGYFIPAGTTIIANAWTALHDEKLYGPDPTAFNPYRFMMGGREGPPNPELFAFGFGRRICPGRYLAMNSIYLAVSRLIATFTIARPLDDAGNEITPEIAFADGVVRYTKLPPHGRVHKKN
ncbi:hypothetical protein PQX77_012963 [Marasmius sp. AFHP31]|nr:hypothetical protein PQX77_012963 [Marasmius sp. AFHP31]